MGERKKNSLVSLHLEIFTARSSIRWLILSFQTRFLSTMLAIRMIVAVLKETRKRKKKKRKRGQ